MQIWRLSQFASNDDDICTGLKLFSTIEKYTISYLLQLRKLHFYQNFSMVKYLFRYREFHNWKANITRITGLWRLKYHKDNWFVAAKSNLFWSLFTYLFTLWSFLWNISVKNKLHFWYSRNGQFKIDSILFFKRCCRGHWGLCRQWHHSKEHILRWEMGLFLESDLIYD